MTARQFTFTLSAVLVLAVLSLARIASAQNRPSDKPSPKAVPALTANERAAVMAQLGLRTVGEVGGVYVSAKADGRLHRRHKRDGENGCEHIEQDAAGTVRLHMITEKGALIVRRWDANGVKVAEEHYLPDGTPHGRHWRLEPLEPGGPPVEVDEVWVRGVKQ